MSLAISVFCYDAVYFWLFMTFSFSFMMWCLCRKLFDIASYINFGVPTEDIILCREIINTMVDNFRQAIFQDRKPVFDGRKNLYTAQPLPIGKQKVGL